MPDYIIEMGVSQLRPNPLNSTIYDENQKALEELKQSIELNGLLEPITITRSHLVISGHRRLQALLDLDIETCDCRLSTFENETIATIELNRYRVKTESEIVREAKILKDEFSKYIKKGRPLKGEVRDGKNLSIIEVSKTLGVSTTKLKKLLSIQKHDPALLKQIDLGLISVERAYQQVRIKYIKGEDDNNYSNKNFRSQMDKLLKKYNPPFDVVYNLLVKHYPNEINE